MQYNKSFSCNAVVICRCSGLWVDYTVDYIFSCLNLLPVLLSDDELLHVFKEIHACAIKLLCVAPCILHQFSVTQQNIHYMMHITRKCINKALLT